MVLDCRNAFSRVYLPDLEDNKRRKPIPLENIRRIQQDCRVEDDEARWLVALIADTGMRLSEAAGLHIDDIVLEDDTPYINLTQHPWRSLKTKGSQRQIPLVGSALWAARRIKEANGASLLRLPSIQQDDHHQCQLSLSRYQQVAQAKGARGMRHPLLQTLAQRPPKGRGVSFRHD
jgi:integrase